MSDQFLVPEEYTVSFRRVLPYLAASLQKNSQIHESIVLYLKLGGEKMARIAIDAMNVTQRLHDAEVKKQLREQELLNDDRNGDLDDEDEDENQSDEENDEDDGDDGDDGDELPDEASD